MHNSEAFISETINSVLNQTYNHWELILIDDCSNDDTIAVASSFQLKNTKIKLLKNTKNLGAAQSRNKGINVAKGDYIAFLDADDLWKPTKLETQIKFMQTHNCDVCYTSYEQINDNGKPLNKYIEALPVLSYARLLKSNYIGNLTGVYNAKALGKINAPNFKKRQDWLLWLKAIEVSGKPAKGIQTSLAYYRVRKNAMSSNKINLIKHNYKVYRKGLRYSTLKSIYYMFQFLFEHFFVKSKQVKTINKK